MLEKINHKSAPKKVVNAIITLYHQGQFLETIKNAQLILEKYPESFMLWNILGAANKNLNRISDAEVAFTRVTELNPTYDIGHNNLGIVLQEAGKLEKAIDAYNNAITLKPDYFEAYYNMGNALKDQNMLEEAVQIYKKAIVFKPDYFEAFYNMGNALKELNNLEEAIEAFKKALSIKPDFAEAYNNMGIALKERSKIYEAIESYNKALLLKPDYPKAYNNMGISLTGIIFKKPNKGLQNTIGSLLEKKIYVRPADIAVTAISLLKLEPSLKKLLKKVRSVEVIQNPLDIISELDELPLLRKLMSICPLPDLELERLLKNLRSSILENILSLKKSSPELLRFQSTLALQCFTNEYVYSQSKDEEYAVSVLENKVKEILNNNEQPNPLKILILASYKALHKYDWYQSLVVTKQIQEVFTRQVEEPNQEEKLKLNFPLLQEISNKVSKKVRQQYEERPYPRWVNLCLNLKPSSIRKVTEELQLKLNNEKINEVKNPNVLIAGCGTGQHAITTAARFKSSKILAIDLSLSSLAYAKRKTEELAIENIEYMQADILNLGKLNKQFDIIESVGVLHHMDNPMKGWKVLTDCLKPDGLMRIGLYSELARKNIVKIRKVISQIGIGSSDAEIRSFRNMMIDSSKKNYDRIFKSSDFYSLSALKDLLFHVQEHRFTIPIIKDYLNELGLKFCGFESSKIVSRFKLTNKQKEDLYNLDKWQAYEEANPIAFAEMYQLWCQKDN